MGLKIPTKETIKLYKLNEKKVAQGFKRIVNENIEYAETETMTRGYVENI